MDAPLNYLIDFIINNNIFVAGADEQSLMDALPERLRARIAIQIHVKTLKKVSLSQTQSDRVLHSEAPNSHNSINKFKLFTRRLKYLRTVNTVCCVS